MQVHCQVSREVGAKIDGSAWPVPHLESVKVLDPKWRNIVISDCCHVSWETERDMKLTG